MRNLILGSLIFFSNYNAIAQERDTIIDLEQVLVKSVRVNDLAPFVKTEFTLKDIGRQDLGSGHPLSTSV